MGGECIRIEDLYLPYIDATAADTFWLEFPDLLLPYIVENSRNHDLSEIRNFYNEGPYELHHAILQSEDIVIDCGANMGCFSTIAAKKAAIVYAFEPDPDIIKKYLSVTAKYAPNVIIENCALGEKSGTAKFERNIENIGAGKLNENGGDLFDVNVVSLDEFVKMNKISRVDYIKADIEGAERNMLRGATEVLKNFAPKLSICTYHFPDDKEILENIVLEANPQYIITHDYMKMYAYVPK